MRRSAPYPLLLTAAIGFGFFVFLVLLPLVILGKGLWGLASKVVAFLADVATLVFILVIFYPAVRILMALRRCFRAETD